MLYNNNINVVEDTMTLYYGLALSGHSGRYTTVANNKKKNIIVGTLAAACLLVAMLFIDTSVSQPDRVHNNILCTHT